MAIPYLPGVPIPNTATDTPATTPPPAATYPNSQPYFWQGPTGTVYYGNYQGVPSFSYWMETQDPYFYAHGGWGGVAGGGAQHWAQEQNRQYQEQYGTDDILYHPDFGRYVSGTGQYSPRSLYNESIAMGWIPGSGTGLGGGGGGYGGGGGGGMYYPEFNYDAARAMWNRYSKRAGFGGQDRMGEWARNYFDQALLDFNTKYYGKNPPARIPKEGTSERPNMPQTADFADYLKKNFQKNDLQTIYSGLAPSQRGDYYNQYLGSGRVLSWG